MTDETNVENAEFLPASLAGTQVPASLHAHPGHLEDLQERTAVGNVHHPGKGHGAKRQLQLDQVGILFDQQPEPVVQILRFQLQLDNVGDLAQMLASLVRSVEPQRGQTRTHFGQQVNHRRMRFQVVKLAELVEVSNVEVLVTCKFTGPWVNFSVRSS